MTDSNRRRHFRQDLPRAALIDHPSWGGTFAQIEDISDGGLRLSIDGELGEGDLIGFSLRTKGGAHTKLEAVVKHVMVEDDDSVTAGLEWLGTPRANTAFVRAR